MRHFEFDAFDLDIIRDLQLAKRLAELVIELLLSLGVLLVLAAVVSCLTAVGVRRITVVASSSAASTTCTTSSSVDGVRVHIVSRIVHWTLAHTTVASTLESEQLLGAEAIVRIEAWHCMHTWNTWSRHALWAHHRMPHGSSSSCSLHQTRMHLLGWHLARVGILLHVVEVTQSRLSSRCIMLESARHATLQLVEMVEVIELLMDVIGRRGIHVEHLLLEATQLRRIKSALPIGTSVTHLTCWHSLPRILLRLCALSAL